MKESVVPDLQKALDHIDKLDGGLDAPVIVVGFGCLTRCLSVRSKQRVLTHMLLAPTKGMCAADVEQMTMRFAGRTTERRLENTQDDKVACLMPQSDYELVHQLPGLTKQALLQSGTGRIEDIDNWMSHDYEGLWCEALETKRKHARGRLTVNLDKARDANKRKREVVVLDDDDDDDEAVVPDNDAAAEEDLDEFGVAEKVGARFGTVPQLTKIPMPPNLAQSFARVPRSSQFTFIKEVCKDASGLLQQGFTFKEDAFALAPPPSHSRAADDTEAKRVNNVVMWCGDHKPVVPFGVKAPAGDVPPSPCFSVAVDLRTAGECMIYVVATKKNPGKPNKPAPTKKKLGP
jgi:hypothetical protein